MRPMLTLVTSCLLVMGLAGLVGAQEIVAPPEGRSLEAITRDRPERYAQIPESAGHREVLLQIAAGLQHTDPEQTFRNIHAHISGKVPHVPLRSWRPDHLNADRLVHGFDHRNCASHALLFANLLRACGVPCVYVKSMRHDWIRQYVATKETGTISGHVFLEVFYGGQWRLLDAQGMQVWDKYDPANPELPGGLLAYEKGHDHFQMVHSTRRDLFIAECKARFLGCDTSKLVANDANGRSLLAGVFAITLDLEWQALSQRVPDLSSFNQPYWNHKKAEVAGNLLIITAMGGRVGLPEEDHAEWLPITQEDLEEIFLEGKSVTVRKQREDGTVVLLLAAPGRDELMQLIWRTNLHGVRAQMRPQ